MDIFGSLFSRRHLVDMNAELARKQEEAFSRPRFIGFDVGRDDMTAEATWEMQPDGRLRLISVNTFRRTLDLKGE